VALILLNPTTYEPLVSLLLVLVLSVGAPLKETEGLVLFLIAEKVL
jgi:hypothetical protein